MQTLSGNNPIQGKTADGEAISLHSHVTEGRELGFMNILQVENDENHDQKLVFIYIINIEE